MHAHALVCYEKKEFSLFFELPVILIISQKIITIIIIKKFKKCKKVGMEKK